MPHAHAGCLCCVAAVSDLAPAIGRLLAEVDFVAHCGPVESQKTVTAARLPSLSQMRGSSSMESARACGLDVCEESSGVSSAMLAIETGTGRIASAAAPTHGALALPGLQSLVPSTSSWKSSSVCLQVRGSSITSELLAAVRTEEGSCACNAECKELSSSCRRARRMRPSWEVTPPAERTDMWRCSSATRACCCSLMRSVVTDRIARLP